jgi:disulfide bond formation protein DsbB
MSCPFRDCANKALTMPKSVLIVLAGAVVALAFALLMQYGFGLHPCVLCLWQRAPFGAVIVLAGLASLAAMRRYASALLALSALAYLTGAGLAIFHTGVERHWWLGTSGCSITPLSGTSTEDLRTQLLHTVVARCDEIAWTFLGLSMANYNVIYSLALALFALLAARKAGS